MAQETTTAQKQVTARVNGTMPDGPKGLKAELESLRERMRGVGFSYDEIAAELARRYRARPREAYRLAYGWTLDYAAARFNARAAKENTDPEARASLTGSRLCEYEKWPDSTRKPSIYVLCMLAQIYETDVLCLLDLADHESLPQQDRLVLLRRPRAGNPFGEKLLTLMEARGWSLREMARRVPCSASYLSNLIHGRRRTSEEMASRLDDALEASGELAALAEMQARDDQVVKREKSPARAPDALTAAQHGISLSLPYVPGRLVIEISGPGMDGEPKGGLTLAEGRDTMCEVSGLPIRVERKKRGWTAQKMAQMLLAVAGDPCDIPHVDMLIRMIRTWESGKHAPTEMYRILYCKALGMTEDELFATGERTGET
jgi:transcriptional regulator with XRE-family HTH domain